jgi:hypothetical protein
MLQAKSLAQRGRRMPMAITEWNPESLDTGSLPGAAEYWRDKNEVSRVALTAEALFGMMRHPDQFALADYFFYDCSHNGYDLIQQHDGTIAPTAAYWLFWALRDMSGARVYAGSDTASSPVNAIASVDGGRLTVALWNSAPVERRIRLFELRRSGAGLGRIRVDRLRYDASTEAFVHGTDDAKAWPESVTLAPGEVRVVSGDLPPGFKYAASLNERDVYADQTAVTVGIGSVEVKLPGMSVARNEQAYLRMAFSCDDMGAARRIDLTLNGHPVRCPMEPDAREEKPRTVAYLDIPVPAVWLANPNRIVLAPAPTPYKLMFASLAALPRPGGAPGLQSLPAVSEAENRVDVDASLPAEARPGENRLTITVRSRAAHPLKFHIAISSPAGWSVLTAPESVNVPANGVARAECVLRAPEGRLREAVAVRVVLTSGGLPDQDVICHTTYQPNLLAAYVASPPVLDGNDIGWPAPIDVEDQPALSSGGNSYRTETRLAWDAAYLYVCVRVTGRELMTVAAGKEPWGRDTMEAFFDFANAKRAKRGPGTIQSVSVLQRDDTHAPDAFDSVVDANGSPVTRACPAGRRIAVVREANGFVAQAAFPWRDLAAAAGADDATAFTPKDGSRIGFELALAGRSVVSGGSAASEWPTPSRWGTLTLVPASPGLQVTQRQP